MSTKEIDKNFSLSAAFSEYLIQNPSVLKSVPANAQIIMGDERDPKLTKKNQEIFKRKSDGGLFQAIRQKKNGWTLLPIK